MKNETTGLSRRSFIKTSAGISSGLLIGFMVPAYAGRFKKLLGDDPDKY